MSLPPSEAARMPPDGIDPLSGTEPAGIRLPTLQRNALCKLFNRTDFSPHEVYAVGYQRLQRAEGIGDKGLQAIVAWLACHGYDLRPPLSPEPSSSELPHEVQRAINRAVRLLRHYGYRVQRARR